MTLRAAYYLHRDYKKEKRTNRSLELLENLWTKNFCLWAGILYNGSVMIHL